MSEVIFSQIKDQYDQYIRKSENALASSQYDYALVSLYRGLSLVEILGDSELLWDLQLKAIRIFHCLGQSEAVVEWCERVMPQVYESKQQAELYSFWMVHLLHMGRFEKVQELLSRLEIEIDPYLQVVYYAYSGLLHLYLYKYLRQHGLRQVERDLKQALVFAEELDWHLSEIWYYRGIFFLEEGLYFYAKEELLKVQEAEVDFYLQVQVLNELGRAYLYLYEYDLAQKHFTQAQKLAKAHCYDVGLYYNHYYRGLYAQRNLELEKARAHYITALHKFNRLRRYPEIAQIYYYLYQLEEREQPIKGRMYLEEYRSQLNHLHWHGEAPILEEVHQLVEAEVS